MLPPMCDTSEKKVKGNLGNGMQTLIIPYFYIGRKERKLRAVSIRMPTVRLGYFVFQLYNTM